MVLGYCKLESFIKFVAGGCVSNLKVPKTLHIFLELRYAAEVAAFAGIKEFLEVAPGGVVVYGGGHGGGHGGFRLREVGLRRSSGRKTSGIEK